MNGAAYAWDPPARGRVYVHYVGFAPSFQEELFYGWGQVVYGVRVPRHELKITFGVLVGWVFCDLVGESVALAQSVDVVWQLLDFLPE